MSETGSKTIQREQRMFYAAETYDMPTGGQQGLGGHLGALASKAQDAALAEMAEQEAEHPHAWAVRRVRVVVEVVAEATR